MPARSKKLAKPSKKKIQPEALCQYMPPSVHREVLKFLNDALRPDDLMFGPPLAIHSHPDDPHPEHHPPGEDQHEPFIEPEMAQAIMHVKESRFPLGFRHWEELRLIDRFRPEVLDHLVRHFSRSLRGQWQDFPQDIPRRGDGTRDGVVHAALLKTGKVLFITADETTLLWDPEDATPATWEDPVNQPHTMPGGYSQLCGHHVQLSDADGTLLSVGGGGYSPSSAARAAYLFDPTTRTWRRSANDMVNHKWYPTAVSLGGQKILVASGQAGSGDMEVFDEATETFSPITGDTHSFPNLYPGLHILPNNLIFYTRTGWGGPGAGPGGTSYSDDTVNPTQLGGKRPAYFTFDPGYTGGTWQRIKSSPINRTKGMSVVLTSPTPPHVRILVLGGADAATNDTYEIIDASVMTPTASFDPWQPVPDGQHRSLCSGVLLPDGRLFVCGGLTTTHSPCTLFDPQTNTWRPMASLPSIRNYHSVALLLPSGQVMMAGWHNKKIEIYSPPYLFRGPRPEITRAPGLVHHGAPFSIESPQAATVARVVFVRPMAVTHQTDSEQRVIELLPVIYDPAHPTTLKLTAPDGGHPHPMAPRGHYMMFAIDIHGVPSVAEWVYLH